MEPQVLFARFRRRELLRIYLRDIRRLATIAEITEEISNLADAILESALELAYQRDRCSLWTAGHELTGTEICRELLSASPPLVNSVPVNSIILQTSIWCLFIQMRAQRRARAARGSVTNREYFVKLAEYTTKLVAAPSGEGAAYRVDVRLRPHGSLGALALSVSDMIRYYRTEARPWERQVMIRSRGCAGDIELFTKFFAAIEDLVFSKSETVESALASVRRSKELIDRGNINPPGLNVKLGPGGIREIEFIAQALQLAHGGSDPWIRSPHTLISLSRLADRHHFSEAELSELASAYEFLRRTEHVLQMENGVQTHTVPDEPEKRALLRRRMTFAAGGDFELDLKTHTHDVRQVYSRVFSELNASAP